MRALHLKPLQTFQLSTPTALSSPYQLIHLHSSPKYQTKCQAIALRRLMSTSTGTLPNCHDCPPCHILTIIQIFRHSIRSNARRDSRSLDEERMRRFQADSGDRFQGRLLTGEATPRSSSNSQSTSGQQSSNGEYSNNYDYTRAAEAA